MIEYLAAVILAGTVTVFLPCTYPMLIGYIALIVGDAKSGNTLHALYITGWFFVGFSATYAFFGSLAGLFGQVSQTSLLFNESRQLLAVLGAVFFIAIGLVLLRALPLPQKLRGIRSIPLPKGLSFHSWWGALLVGGIFAAGWSPCIGPVLGGILILAGSSGSVAAGALLMFLFAVGMMLPLVVLTILYSKVSGYLQGVERYIPIMRFLGGALFILIGVSFLLEDFSFLGDIQPPAYFEKYI